MVGCRVGATTPRHTLSNFETPQYCYFHQIPCTCIPKYPFSQNCYTRHFLEYLQRLYACIHPHLIICCTNAFFSNVFRNFFHPGVIFFWFDPWFIMTQQKPNNFFQGNLTISMVSFCFLGFYLKVCKRETESKYIYDFETKKMWKMSRVQTTWWIQFEQSTVRQPR